MTHGRSTELSHAHLDGYTHPAALTVRTHTHTIYTTLPTIQLSVKQCVAFNGPQTSSREPGVLEKVPGVIEEVCRVIEEVAMVLEDNLGVTEEDPEVLQGVLGEV